jgi:phage shock protein A
MGKKIVIGMLLALIIAAALFEYFYVKDASERLAAALEQVQSALARGDEDLAIKAAEEFNQSWEKEKQRLEALYDHEEVDIISATAKRIQSDCAAGDRDDALAEVSAALFYVNHLFEMIGVRWENIF